MENCPSFNLFLSCIMFVVPMLVSLTHFHFEKKVVFDIMSSLSFFVFVPFGFLLALTSTILNTYFYPFILNDWTTLINLQSSFYRWKLHLSISKLLSIHYPYQSSNFNLGVGLPLISASSLP